MGCRKAATHVAVCDSPEETGVRPCWCAHLLKSLEEQGVRYGFGDPGRRPVCHPIQSCSNRTHRHHSWCAMNRVAGWHAPKATPRSTRLKWDELRDSGSRRHNAVTGLTDAIMDFRAVVCLRGQVTTNRIGTRRLPRGGMDTVGITRPEQAQLFCVRMWTSWPAINEDFLLWPRSGRPGSGVGDSAEGLLAMATGQYTTAPERYQSHSKRHKNLSSASKPIWRCGSGRVMIAPPRSRCLTGAGRHQ